MANSTPQKYPSRKEIAWFRQQLRVWSESHLRDFPWRRTTESYHLLVAESLLQKTEAQAVVPIYSAFLLQYPTIQSLAGANLEEVKKVLKPLGLLFRAERLHQCARIILEEYGGEIPTTQKALLALPGIGDYTARAIGSQAFGHSLAVLDTNVARIFERFFGLQGERVKSRCKILWGAADAIAPTEGTGRWNLTLLDFGALACKAKKPLCPSCPLATKCCWVR
jgi:A/G-specific adenine glycosylase